METRLKKVFKSHALFFCIILLSQSLLLTSCTSSNKSKAGEISVALAYGPKTLDPRYATGAYGMRIVNLLFSSFVKFDPQLNLVGDAANDWNYADKTYTFHMKPNLRFSDGTEVTAEDIIFSVEAFKKEDVPFQSSFQIIESVSVEKDKSNNSLIVKMKLSQPSAKFLMADLPVLKILPKKLVEKYGKDFDDHILGSGSYKLKDFSSHAITLDAVKNHPFAPPKNNRLIFKLIRDDFTRYQKMIRGEVDIALSELPTNKIVDFEAKPDEFTIYKYPGVAMTYVLLNFKHKLLNQLNFRKALSHAINIDEIIKYKLNGYAIPATSILPPQNPYQNNLLKPYHYDLELAKKLLVPYNNQDLTLVLKTSNNKSVIERAKVVANTLSKVGIKIKIQSYEWGTFFGDINEGNFELAMMRWVGALDPDIYRVAFHSQEFPPGRNRARYKNTKLDKLLDKGSITMDSKERKVIFDQVQEIIHNEYVTIPLWYDQQVSVISKRIKNFKPSAKTDYSTLVNAIKN